MIHSGLILFSVGAMALTVGMLSASADTVIRVAPDEGGTVVTRTVTRTEAVNRIDIAGFDINRDGILGLAEVGDRLFKLYDTDGNDVIDNIEFGRRAVVTVIPITTERSVAYDFDNDGVADRTVRTREDFLAGTQLSRFDANLNGLSAEEFSGRDFNEVDVDDSKVIEPNEWRGVYIAQIDRENREAARYNE